MRRYDAVSGWNGQPAPGDATAERVLRTELRDAVDRLLGTRPGLALTEQDEARIRELIHERVGAFNRRAATTGAPVLVDPDGLELRLFNSLLRMDLLQALIDDPEVEEIMINAPDRIFVHAHGHKRFVSELVFENEEHLLGLIKRLAGSAGRRLDESSPLVDVRLPDGSRLNAAIPPATTRGCVVTIRKFLRHALTLADLVSSGALPVAAAQFLDAAVQAAVTILISGPTGSGKTTLINMLGASIAAPDERVVCIEELPELQLDRHLPDCIALQARSGNIEGAGEIRIRELVKNALRMRPTRIIIGEVRGAEALDLLLALNTGHAGSLATIHGNTPRDALDRLVLLATMAEERVSYDILNGLAARAIELVVQLRFEPRSGRRRVAGIFEVTGLDGGVITGNDLWVWDDARDRLVWSGIRPRCLAKLAARDVAYSLPPDTGVT